LWTELAGMQQFPIQYLILGSPPAIRWGEQQGHGSYLESISALAELSAHEAAGIGAYRFCHERDFIESDGKFGCCHLFSNRKYDALQCLLYAVFL